MLFKKKKDRVEGQAVKEKIEEKGIFVLGSGCAKCNQLEDHVKKALKTLGIEEEIHHIKDFVQIAAYGVMSTPALVVDGKVVSYGQTLSEKEALDLIRAYRG